jgi:hypothetical protein
VDSFILNVAAEGVDNIFNSKRGQDALNGARKPYRAYGKVPNWPEEILIFFALGE